MANEKRLIDANALLDCFEKEYNQSTYPYFHLDEITDEIMLAPTVDAVEAKKYEELVGMYHELRENFVDYVCSGIPNVAPYCLNKCEGCVTVHGWCKFASDKCKGFNPAEVILYRFAKMDGDGNG